jgi:G:T-mismatch repair DNA endonuclease (very short patch repair protein)
MTDRSHDAREVARRDSSVGEQFMAEIASALGERYEFAEAELSGTPQERS